jgi:hypothetical protein
VDPGSATKAWRPALNLWLPGSIGECSLCGADWGVWETQSTAHNDHDRCMGRDWSAKDFAYTSSLVIARKRKSAWASMRLRELRRIGKADAEDEVRRLRCGKTDQAAKRARVGACTYAC